MSESLVKERKEISLEEQLKVCPVCKTVSFADMETCFSCLYHFDKREVLLHCEDNSESFQNADEEHFDEDGNFCSVKDAFVVESIGKISCDDKAHRATLGTVSFIDKGFEISIAVRPLKG